MHAEKNTSEGFRRFLDRVARGHVVVEDWNRFAITHYDDPIVESARVELVQQALTLGQCSARTIPAGLEKMASDLLSRLPDGES